MARLRKSTSTSDSTHAEPSEHVRQSDARTKSAREPKQRKKTQAFVYATGILIAVLGIALAVLPNVLHGYGWVLKSAARYGITSAPLLMSGILVCGMGLIARTRNTTPAPAPAPLNIPQQSSDKLALEQLASDVALMRGGLQELRIEMVYVKDVTQSVLQATHDRGVTAPEDGQQDALFRLAASLDQVGARIDQRLRSQHTALQDTLLEINATMLAMRAEIAEIAHGGIAGRDGESGYEIRSRSDERGEEPADIGGIAASKNGAAESSDLEVWVELEQDAPSLGLLDSLDDFGQMQTRKTSPSIQPSIIHGSGRRELIEAQDSTAAPLPSKTGEKRGRNTSETIPLHDGEHDTHGIRREGEMPIEGKLDQLKSLLGDARVRKALEELRRRV